MQKSFNGWSILVWKQIAKKIGDREAAIAILIAIFDRDRDRDLNFGDRANALPDPHSFFRMISLFQLQKNIPEMK